MSDPFFIDGSGPAIAVSAGARSFGEVFRRRVAATPNRTACVEKLDGRWVATSWRQLYDRAARVARLWVDRGLEVGDRIAIVGPTSLDYAVHELAGHLAGLVTVGIYPKQTPEQVRYIVDHCAAKAIVVGSADEVDTVLLATEELPELATIVPWNVALQRAFAGRDSRVVDLSTVTGSLRESEIDERLAAIKPADTAILIYTSGTTGPPKGAMITQANLMAFLATAPGRFSFRADDLMLSFLPMAHASERVMSFFVRIDQGLAAAYASSVGKVAQEIAEVRPTIFGSVPRLFEKIHAGVGAKVAEAPAVRRKLFAWARRVGWQRAQCELAGRRVGLGLRLRHAVADRLVLTKIRALLGGRVRVGIVGAAPISFDVLEFFWAIGIPLFEAYGMTEATVVSHANVPGDVRLGTVGRAVPGLEHRLAEDGEVLLRGPIVFAGYYRQEEATAEALEGGWLHTGDIGTIDADGYLRITDRKKHLIVTAGGKNIAPANVEKALKAQSPLISQVHVHGDRRAFVTALIAPSPLETLAWGALNGALTVDEADARRNELLADPQSRSPALAAAMAKVVADPRFSALFVEPVRTGNRSLARVERVRRFMVLERDFSVEGGELTPTMKMRRKEIERMYGDRFDRLYSDPSFGADAETASD